MNTLLSLAISPALICLFYMYIRDKYEKEPFRLLLVGLIFGAVSIFPIMQIEGLLASFMPILGRYGEAFYESFFVASLAEEGFKFILLFLIFYKHKERNEPIDAIIYAVFLSLGFAMVENVLYVFHPDIGGIDTALSRALISVPAHGLFGIIMGYYFAEGKLFRAFLVPFIIHGVYDFILLSEHRLYLLVFVPFLLINWHLGFKKIKNHLQKSPFRKI